MRTASSAVGVFSFLVVAAVASGQTVYSDFGANSSFSTNGWCVSGASSPSCGPSVTRWIAAPFTPTGTVALASITLALTNVSGTNGAVVNLLTDSNGSPGTVLQAWTVANLTAYPQPGTTTVTSNTNVTLQAGQRYWVEVEGSAPDSMDYWLTNNLGLAGGLQNIGGAGWTALSGYAGQSLPAFSVVGVQPATMTASPASLSFTAVVGQLPASQSISVNGSGGAVSYSVSAQYSSGPTGWISASPVNGVASPGSPGIVTVAVAPAASTFAAGTYLANLVLSSATQVVTVPISLQLTTPITVVQGSEPTFANQRVTTQAPSASACVVPPAVTSFLTTDNIVYLYFEATVTTADSLSSEWLTPDGVFLNGANWGQVSGDYCFDNNGLAISNLPPFRLGSWQALVYNNGNLLFSIPFTVNGGAPSVTSLYPSSATAGGPSFTLSVNGTSFASGAAVNWNGTALPTTLVSATQLTATVAASLIASAGTASISVSSSGQLSNTINFTISPPPQPTAAAIITTVAGTDWHFPTQSLPALSAPLGAIAAIAVDQAGNVYAADTNNNVVERISPDGTLTVVAGNGIAGFSGDGGPATSASLNSGSGFLPGAASEQAGLGGLAVDLFGNLYIADTLNSRIRKVSGGIITTVAGNGNQGFSGDGGPATSASLNTPWGIAVDSAGDLYIADNQNSRIRKVSGGIITTIAGNGSTDSSGDGGLAINASLVPLGLAIDSSGTLYVVDSNRIRKISQGTITTVAGNGNEGDSGDGGPATAASLNNPLGVAVDISGNIYIADTGNSRVRKVSGGIITAFADMGNPGFSGGQGPATNAPFAVATNLLGNNVYIADVLVSEGQIRKVSGGTSTIIAGNDGFSFAGDGASSIASSLQFPRAVTADSTGSLYIADYFNFRVRKLSGGIISTVAGSGSYYGLPGDNGPAINATIAPTGVVVDSHKNLYIADESNWRVAEVSGGIITTVAGNGSDGYSGDGGPATNASLGEPEGVALDSLGNLYIADPDNQRIRKVSGGIITTVAGNGNQGFSGDGGLATRASLNSPWGVAVDSLGDLYIADYGNYRIRKVSGGIITTVAGNGTSGFSGDGGPATSASLSYVVGVGTDSAGNLFITDGNRVREVSGGIITTVAGNGTAGFSGDGAAATSASMNLPSGIAVDSQGNLYIADYGNNRVRAVLNSAPSFSKLLQSGALALAGSSEGKPVTANLTVATTATATNSISLPGMAYTAQVGAGSSWLSISPSTGATPGLVTVTADPSNLTPGSYQGSITINVPNANPATQTVNVQFMVGTAAAKVLSVDHTHLSFTYSNTSAVRTQTITVSNAGGGQLFFNAAVTLNSGQSANWLTVTPSSGAATPATPDVLTVQADPTQLPPGVYTGQVAFSSAAGSPTVTVTMTITTNPLVMLLSQTGLTFTAVQNGGTIPSQTFSVLNLGSEVLPWSVQTSVLGGVSNWLAATPSSGSSNAGSANGTSVVTVSMNPAGLPPGIYYGLVTVTSQGAANTPQAVVVVLQVLAAGTDVAPIVQPNSLVFTGAAGDSSPGSQTVQVYDPTGTGKSFRSGIATVNGGKWLVTQPSDGTIPANQSTQMVVQPLVNNLSPGTYPGTVTLEFSDGRVSAVGIQFIVTGSGGAGAATDAAGRARPLEASAQPCTPTKLLPSLLTLGTGFSLPAGYPQGLEAQVVDNCGAPQVDGTVFVQFTNGDAPVKLQSLGNGIWDGMWPVGAQATSQVTLTVIAQNAAAITGQSQINGALGTAAPPPVLTDQGVVSVTSAGPGAETPLAPGGLISIYGQQLSDGQSQVPPNTPLPPALNGATVLIGSQAASAGGQFQTMPIVFASQGQVNVQVPFEVTANTNQQLIFQRDYTYAAPVSVDIAAAQPGIFQSNQQALIYDVNNSLIGPGNPAHAGDTIVIYCAGLGAVNSQPPDGAVTPDTSSTVVNPVSVSIGGSTVAAVSAGLLPGMVGVYQVTVTVPQGVAPGDGVQVSLMVAGQSSPAVNVSVR
jgi:uncharacterized protein (TIGR03437 family)